MSVPLRRPARWALLASLLAMGCVQGCGDDPLPCGNGGGNTPAGGPAVMEPCVIREILHQGSNLYTEGLTIWDGLLWESDGLDRASCLKKMRLSDGSVLLEREVPDYFSEGITVWDAVIVNLSYEQGTAYTYDKIDLSRRETTYHYASQGWGLTHDATHLIMSDGSDKIYFRDAETFRIDREIAVTLDGDPVRFLNELEFARGRIYANVWMEPFIMAIDPETGVVDQWINASRLLCSQLTFLDVENVLNGIAYDPAADTFYLTGKGCPVIYEVRFAPAPAPAADPDCRGR